MSILIGNYEFDGPYSSVDDLEHKQGIFAVLHCAGDEVYELIHVAHADNIKARIELSQSAYSLVAPTVKVAACYTPGCGSRERAAMVDKIEYEFNERESSPNSQSEGLGKGSEGGVDVYPMICCSTPLSLHRSEGSTSGSSYVLAEPVSQ